MCEDGLEAIKTSSPRRCRQEKEKGGVENKTKPKTKAKQKQNKTKTKTKTKQNQNMCTHSITTAGVQAT